MRSLGFHREALFNSFSTVLKKYLFTRTGRDLSVIGRLQSESVRDFRVKYCTTYIGHTYAWRVNHGR